MSKKQLGTLPGQDNGARAAERLGWFGRLRAQPGFRTAAVAFFVTIALGLGGPAAYALWSQSVASTLTGTVAKLPAVAQPRCDSKRSPTMVSWERPVGMPGDAVYLIEVTKTGKKAGTLVYAFPAATTSFEPAYLWVGQERFDDWMDGSLFDQTTANITVSVGALASAPDSPVKLINPAAQVLARSDPSPVTRILSKRTELIPWYVCQ